MKIIPLVKLFRVVVLFSLTARAAETIRPGEIWPDDRGEHIQAHGGGILKFGDTFYWFGEDRAQNLDGRSGHVSCYSSTNLTDWKFCKDVLNLAAPTNFGRRLILERPKVFYNAPTKKFVMYFHMDNGRYQMASVGIATCATADGDYKFLKYFRPLGHESRDIGQFIDDDGGAYLISEDRPNGFHIYKLSDDYLSVTKDVCLIPEHLEGGAMVHYEGLYYVLGSHLTGWNPNPNVYATAKNLRGPWSEFRDLAPPEKNTYGAQSTMLWKITGTKTTSVIFMGDLWRPQTQWDSRYLWMPLEIGGGKMKLPEPRDWTLDVQTGEAKILN
jgi:glycosyl hydrolase family 43